MYDVSVSEMKKWLYNVMETERRILVLDNVIADISSQLQQCSRNFKIAKPKTYKINFREMIYGAIGGGVLGIVVTAVFMVIALAVYTIGLRGILGIKSDVIVPLGIMIISVIIMIVCILSGFWEEISNTRKANKKEQKKYEESVNREQIRKNAAQIQIPYLKKQYDELTATRDKLERVRSKLYQNNFLDKSYRGFIPTATMYGYLTSGRCTVIYGHGGIIDTYVHDAQFNILNRKLDKIVDMLDEIRSSQIELAHAIEQNIMEQRKLTMEVKTFARQNHQDSMNMIECQRYSAQCLNWIANLETYRSY